MATPPYDLTNTGDSVFLLEWTTDRNRQASQSDQIILLDIVLTGDDPTAGPHTTRRVLWIRHTTTRQGVLHVTSSAAICERETIECRVYINHRLWANDDEMPRQLSHGDYVGVHIRGIHSTTTELQVDLCEQESADQQRYLFHSSPQKSPTSPTLEQSGTESIETGEDDGKDRSRSPHGREIGQHEGNVLLQLSAEMRPYTTTPHRTTSYPEEQRLILRMSEAHEVPCRGDTTYAVSNGTYGGEYHDDGEVCTSFRQLAPPGNGPSFQLDTMDDCVPFAGHYLVFDYVAVDVSENNNEEVRSTPPGDGPPLSGVEFPPEVALTFQSLCHGECRSMDVENLPEHEWHEATLNLLQQRARVAASPMSPEVFVYTDGSAGQVYQQEHYSYQQRATWAFSIWWLQPQGWRLLAYDSGNVTMDEESPYWTGASQLSSSEGEKAALLAAAVCVIRSGLRGHLTFCFDATAAGYGGAGFWGTPVGSKDSSLLRSVFQLVHELQPCAPQFLHVKAHQGDPLNEFVNTLAYDAYIVGKENPVLDFDVRGALHGRRPACEQWILLWCSSQGHHDYPVFDTHHLHWTTPTTRPRPEVVWDGLGVQSSWERWPLNITVATYNVRSLQSTGERFAGLTAYLRAQCAERHIDIVCLQETRVRTSQVVSFQDYVRFTSACDDSGQGGTEIWLKKFQHGKPSPLLKERNYLVLHHDSECLILQLKVHGTEFFIVSAHAPHSGVGKESIESWWKSFDNLLGGRVGLGHVIIGIDANTHFQWEVEGIVGTCDLERRSSASSETFVSLLKNQDLWLPSTFSECHFGPSGTWKHMAYGSWHRNDYICLSHSLQCSEVATWVDGTLDSGGSNVDHLALLAQIRCSITGPAHKRSKKPKINVAAIREADPQKLWATMTTLPPIPWEVSVHEHGTIFTRQLIRALEQAFPATQRPPHREYISASTWELRGSRNEIRRRLYHRHRVHKTSHLRAVLQAWRHDQCLSQVFLASRVWELRCILADMADRLQLRRLNHQLKQQLAEDRRLFCEQVSREANQASPSFVIQKLRAIGAAGRQRRRAPMVLPAMNDEDGRAVASIEELNDLWRRHFENMEDGFSISKEELLTRCNDSQNPRATPIPSWSEIPSLHDLERSLRQNRYGKSALFHGIPSRAFFPLFVKQTLLIREPVGFKGGVLVHAFKNKGSAKECKNYRALMVSSVLAKSAHRILRNDLMQTFQEGALPLQVGGLPGKGVGQGAQCLWAFSSMCRQKEVSAAFLFVDIRQAFYRVIRSHVVDIGTFDESVERLFRTLKLPSNSFADFVKEVESRTAVQEAGVSPFLAAHLTESMLYTWFQLPTDPGISQTRKGSRPGDNLADLLFSFSFKKILKSVMDELKAMEIDLSFETIADRNPYPYQQTINKEICFDSLGPVWADDLAILIWDESPHRIIEKTAVVAQVLIDALAIRGMDANLDRGKTELIFDLRGHGAHEAKAKIFRHADPVIPVCSRLLGDIFVRVVTSYKHLGTIYTSAG